MSRSMSRLGAFLVLAATFGVAPVHAEAPKWVVKELRERYPRSYIEIQSAPVAGRVFGPEAVLLVQADGVPANPLRISQLNTKSPRFHVGDFAPVEIGEDSRLAARPAAVVLPRGTRLSVLDLTVDTDVVRLFTHTIEPVAVASGRPVYGCTEFVFRFDPAVLDRGDVLTIEGRIDAWLPLVDRRR